MLVIRKTRYLSVLGFFLFVTFTFPPVLVAEVPDLINYQGVLTDTAGNPVPVGNYEMVFTLHTTEVGDTGVWQQTSSAVSIVDGIYNVELGPFIYPVQVFDGDLYLEVEVNGEVLAPRQRLSATAYAMRAVVADGVNNGGVTSVMIADNAVTHEKIDVGAVTSSNIQDGATIDEILDDDGHGSGLDADTLDGQQASFFSPATHNHDTRYFTENEADLRFINVTGDSMAGSIAGSVLSVTNTASDGAGVAGYCYATGGSGVFGQGTMRGIYGYSSAYDGYGVVGEAPGASGEGVRGNASGNYGRAVVGEATYTGGTTCYGGHFTANSTNGRGVFGESTGLTGEGVYGYASNTGGDSENYGTGVYGAAEGSHGHGVYGTAVDRNGIGVYGSATNTGETYNYGGYFRAYGTVGRGVVGRADGESGTGVYGFALGTSSTGVYGHATGRSGIGVYGHAEGESGHAVYGWAPVSSAYAGYFQGRGYFSGYLEKAGGGFKIDHPLEPENKYLNHSFVESPDMMNVYNGNVILDDMGEARVELPDWFEALNKDFRYQLTCIGGYAQIYIAEKISDNRFMIAGGTPGLEVSWQVTGIRKDPWAQANRTIVVEDKPDEELGTYLHPDAYGMPETMGVSYEATQEILQRQEDNKGEDS